MKFKDFSVEVIPGNETANGYVEMVDSTQYIIKLGNFTNVPCDAEITIDGKYIGLFRVEKNSSVTLEHPSHDEGYFTFYTLSSFGGKQSKLEYNSELGLISVIFKPEKENINFDNFDDDITFDNFDDDITFDDFDDDITFGDDFIAGGTGLSGESEQKYTTVESLTYDESKFITINLRLVSKGKNIRPLINQNNATLVPPPVKKGELII